MSKRSEDLPALSNTKRFKSSSGISTGLVASKSQIEAARRQRELARLGASGVFLREEVEDFQTRGGEDDSSEGGDERGEVSPRRKQNEDFGEEHDGDLLMLI